MIRWSAIAASLFLVAACIFAALYLNHAHRKVSKVLTENVASMVADKELETTLDELPFLLRADHSRPDLWAEVLIKRHEKAEQQLDQVRRYANTAEEIQHVQNVQESWRRYQEAWSKRPSASPREELTACDRKRKKVCGALIIRLVSRIYGRIAALEGHRADDTTRFSHREASESHTTFS